MNIQYKKISAISGNWYSQKIPCILFKHKVVKTDPTYKFVINTDVHMRSNISVQENLAQNSYYYDLFNMLTTNNSVLTGNGWFDFLTTRYNISLESGTNFFSTNFSEMGFASIEDRDLFDTLYTNLKDSVLPDGTNVLLDFTLQVSGGFVRNKLGLDTTKLHDWILNHLSLNLLSYISFKDEMTNNFKIRNSYKISLDLTDDDVYCIEELFKYKSPILPQNSDGVGYFWDYLNKFKTLESSISGKQHLLGFQFNKAQVSSVLNKDFSLDVGQNNTIMNLKVKNGWYKPEDNKIYISKPS